MHQLRLGFTAPGPPAIVLAIAAIGLFSQGTGIFGALVLLDSRENSFCVPVNRASSVLAGIVASASLAALSGGRGVPNAELLGAGLVLVAVAVLAAPAITAAVARGGRTRFAAARGARP